MTPNQPTQEELDRAQERWEIEQELRRRERERLDLVIEAELRKRERERLRPPKTIPLSRNKAKAARRARRIGRA